MKKILFTSLLCASFAANVNLLPAPIDETDGCSTEAKAAAVPQAQQDADFLKAQNAVAPLVEDLQKSNRFRGGENSDMPRLLASRKKIKQPAEKLFFERSAFEKLLDMRNKALRIQNNAKNAAGFKATIAEWAKGFDWQDNGENKNNSNIVTQLFALHAALSADKPIVKDVEFAARTLKEKLEPTFTFWQHIIEDVGAMLAKPTTEKIEKVALSAFNHKGQEENLLTTEDAKLLVDTFFAHMFSVRAGFTDKKGIDFKDLGKKISNKYSLSEALKHSINEAEKALYAKIRERNGKKVQSVHDVFPSFLKQTVLMEPEDLKRFAWLGISLNSQDGNVPVSDLLKACYPWHASKISEKNNSDAAAKKEKALTKEIEEAQKALEDLQKKKNELPKTPQSKRK